MSEWATPTGSPTFIQWKGTQVCMDFQCPECRENNHYDADFAYYIRCLNCRAIFEVSTSVAVRKLGDGENTNIEPVEDDAFIESVIYNATEMTYAQYKKELGI